MAIYTDVQRNMIIRKLLKTKEGLFKLGISLQSPVRHLMDFFPLSRKVLVVDILKPYASPVYDISLNSRGIIVATTSKKVKRKKRVERVYIPEFNLWTSVTTTIGKLKNVSNIIAKELGDKEEVLLISLLKAASEVSKQQVSCVNLKDGLRKAIATIELIEHDLKSRLIIIHPDLFPLMIKQFGDTLDRTTHKELREAGLYGNLWGNDIIVTKLISKKTIYVCAEPELIGVLPIRKDPMVFVTSKPNQKQIRLYIEERIGMGIINSKGVCELKIVKKLPKEK